MTIHGRKFIHYLKAIEDIKDNIICIDLMQAHWLIYDTDSKQITFAKMVADAIATVK